jgi:hypothetical protein
MCVVDSLTKHVHFIPMHTTLNAEGTALLFLKEVWKHHGTPRVVVSDRGPQFVAGYTRELYKLLGIELATSTAYHPQTDGQTEHVNQVLEGYLRIFTSRQQDDWDDYLPTGKFHYNNSQHSSTQQTPFMVDTGRHPHMGFEPQQPRSTLESANEFADCIALGIEEAKVALTKAKDEYAMFYNRRREPAPIFAPGDRVWLDGSDIATNQPSSKLSHRCLGPFVIESCIGHGAYHLKLPHHFRRLHPVFPVVNCPSPPLILSFADDLRNPHPQLLSMARRSTRSRQCWTAACVTTAWSTYSSSRVMTRVTINGRFTHMSMQSQR